MRFSFNMAALSKWTGQLHKVLLKRSLAGWVQPFSTSLSRQYAKGKGDDNVPEFIPTSPDELEEQDQPLGGRHFSPPSEEQLKKAQELFDTLLKGSGTVKSTGIQPMPSMNQNTASDSPSPEQLNKAKELFESFEQVVGDDPSDVTFKTAPESPMEYVDSQSPSPTQSQIVRAQQLFENLSGMLVKTETAEEPEVEYSTFASTLRKSSYVGLGNPRGSMVSGKIFDVIDDDLYVDFGGKFHAVCKVPPVYMKRGLGSQG